MLNYLDNMPLLYLITFFVIMISITHYAEIQIGTKNLLSSTPYFTEESLKKSKLMYKITTALAVALSIASMILFFNTK